MSGRGGERPSAAPARGSHGGCDPVKSGHREDDPCGRGPVRHRLAALSRADFNGLLETHAGIASKIALQLARDLGQKLVARYLTLNSRPQ